MSSSLARLVATVGTLGERLPAAGTLVGSPAGVLLFVLSLAVIPGALWLPTLAGAGILVPLAIWSSGAEATRRGEDDPGAIVIDETAGQWLTLTVVTLFLGRAPLPAELVLSFVLFRLFDVVKPWPIRTLESLPGGWGIVADDLAAGVAAGAVVLVARALATGLG